jgi:hypothetical protein
MSPLSPDSNSSFLPQTLQGVLFRSPATPLVPGCPWTPTASIRESTTGQGERFTGVVVPANVTCDGASAADG